MAFLEAARMSTNDDTFRFDLHFDCHLFLTAGVRSRCPRGNAQVRSTSLVKGRATTTGAGGLVASVWRYLNQVEVGLAEVGPAKVGLVEDWPWRRRRPRGRQTPQPAPRVGEGLDRPTAHMSFWWSAGVADALRN